MRALVWRERGREVCGAKRILAASMASLVASLRLLAFCSAKALLKASSSIENALSRAINAVRSTGKPNVSESSKTVFPSKTFVEMVFGSAKMISSLFNPNSKVLKNVFSSSSTTLVTKST